MVILILDELILLFLLVNLEAGVRLESLELEVMLRNFSAVFLSKIFICSLFIKVLEFSFKID